MNWAAITIIWAAFCTFIGSIIVISLQPTLEIYSLILSFGVTIGLFFSAAYIFIRLEEKEAKKE